MAKTIKLGKPIAVGGGSKKLLADMDKVLKKHGVDGQIRQIRVNTQTPAGTCPPGTTFGCRLVGTSIVCKCWPE
jgi:hypothetical protein